MRRVAAIVLNRNLPAVTDELCDHIYRYDGSETEVFVVEAGSQPDNLSRSVTWHADWPEAMEQGLRYSRGMNFGLSQLVLSGRFEEFDAFFLLTNDTVLESDASVAPLLDILDSHPRVGIVSPCSRRWGERLLLRDSPVKYFWFIHNNAYLVRRELIESIADFDQPDHMRFLFDGDNFRGYGIELELIAKSYANDWAAAITTTVWASEDESHLMTQSDLIRTEPFEENLRLLVEEGQRWMRRKYGFNSRWSMQMYSKFFYEKFFEFHPEFAEYRI